MNRVDDARRHVRHVCQCRILTTMDRICEGESYGPDVMGLDDF